MFGSAGSSVADPAVSSLPPDSRLLATQGQQNRTSPAWAWEGFTPWAKPLCPEAGTRPKWDPPEPNRPNPDASVGLLKGVSLSFFYWSKWDSHGPRDGPPDNEHLQRGKAKKQRQWFVVTLKPSLPLGLAAVVDSWLFRVWGSLNCKRIWREPLSPSQSIACPLTHSHLEERASQDLMTRREAEVSPWTGEMSPFVAWASPSGGTAGNRTFQTIAAWTGRSQCWITSLTTLCPATG